MKKITKLALTLLPAAILAAPTLAMADVNQPEEIIDRPRTLPAGETEVNGTLDILRVSVSDGTTTVNSTNEGLTIGAGYGVTKDFEVRASYAFGLNNFDSGQGDLRVTGAYTLPSSGNLSMAVDGGVGLFVDGTSPDPLTAGLDLQFKLNSQFAIFTPGQQLALAFNGGTAGSPFTGGAINGQTNLTLSLPVGVRYQAAKNIFAFAETNLANISISNGVGNFIFSDFIPLEFGGFYSLSNALDIGANINFFDLKNQSGIFDVGIVARAYF